MPSILYMLQENARKVKEHAEALELLADDVETLRERVDGVDDVLFEVIGDLGGVNSEDAAVNACITKLKEARKELYG